MFDNRVLRKIFGSKRIEVTVEKRRLHNMGLYNLYSLPNYSGECIKKHEMEGHIACMGERGGVYRFWWRNLRGRGT